jgi:hypothetical protein
VNITSVSDGNILQYVQTSGEWQNIDPSGLFGLQKQGTLTSDSLVGEGIYNIDSGGGAFNITLPLSTSN